MNYLDSFNLDLDNFVYTAPNWTSLCYLQVTKENEMKYR